MWAFRNTARCPKMVNRGRKRVKMRCRSWECVRWFENECGGSGMAVRVRERAVGLRNGPG